MSLKPILRRAYVAAERAQTMKTLPRSSRVSSAAAILWIALAFSACEAGPSSESPGATSPNVILIVVDTLRRDHLGVYGYAHNTSPNIDRFAARGG